MALCRRCRVREASDLPWKKGLCPECYGDQERNNKREEERDREQRKEREREREREERDREKRDREERRHNERLEELREEEVEYQRQAALDAEITREAAEETRRIAGLTTFTCCHCQGIFNEEKGYSAIESPIGKPVCNKCFKLLKKCFGCNQYYWLNDSRSTPIRLLEKEYYQFGAAYKVKDRKDYICDNCAGTKLKDFFDEQKVLEKKYEEQERIRKEKEAAERAERERKEAAESAERARLKAAENAKKKELEKQEQIRQAIVEEEEKKARELRKKKHTRIRALSFATIAVAISIGLGYVQSEIVIGFAIGMGALLLSQIFCNLASKLLDGFIFSLIPSAIVCAILILKEEFLWSQVKFQEQDLLIFGLSFIAWIIVGAIHYPSNCEILDVFKSFPAYIRAIPITGLVSVAVCGISYTAFDTLKPLEVVLICSWPVVAYLLFNGSIEWEKYAVTVPSLLFGIIFGVGSAFICAVISWFFITDTFWVPFFFSWATSVFVIDILIEKEIIRL